MMMMMITGQTSQEANFPLNKSVRGETSKGKKLDTLCRSHSDYVVCYSLCVIIICVCLGEGVSEVGGNGMRVL